MSATQQIVLRDYQGEFEPALRKYWKERPGEWPLIVGPPGCGKTIIIASVIKSLLAQDSLLKVCVLAHRKELVMQPFNTLVKVWPGAPVGLFSGSHKKYDTRTITVASRDTFEPNLTRRLSDYVPRLLIIDEAHNISHKETTRYRRIIKTLQGRNPSMMVVGMTATPFDGNNRLLYGEGCLFSGIAHEVKMIRLIREKYLTPLRVLDVDERGKIDTSDVPIVNGDFQLKALTAATVLHHLVKIAVREWYNFAFTEGRKSTLVYCLSLKHAEQAFECFETHGIVAKLIDGNTPAMMRDLILQDFSERKFPVLINVGVLTEGTDIPCVDCILNLRAIQSIVLFIQIFGRGTRLFPGKLDCLILDFGGCVDRFGPIDQAQPAKRRIGKVEPRSKTCPECNTLSGFFCTKCSNPECDHEWPSTQHKVCEKCKTECSLGAKVCPACDHPFINHGRQASSKSMLSTQQNLLELPVRRIYGKRVKSGKTNKWYTRVFYETDVLNEVYSDMIMWGYEGTQGQMAMRKWQRFTRPGTMVPQTAAQAEEIERSVGSENLWLPVKTITVDMNSKYKNIVFKSYADS